jgi:hypothetical protein
MKLSIEMTPFNETGAVQKHDDEKTFVYQFAFSG